MSAPPLGASPHLGGSPTALAEPVGMVLVPSGLSVLASRALIVLGLRERVLTYSCFTAMQWVMLL